MISLSSFAQKILSSTVSSEEIETFRNFKSEEGFTTLMSLAEVCKDEEVYLLLSFLIEKCHYSISPAVIYILIKNINVTPSTILSILKMMVNRGLDIRSCTSSGDTLLHFLSQNDSLFTALKYLSQIGADFNLVNMDGDTVLHNVVMQENIITFCSLIRFPNVDLNIRTRRYNEPLIFYVVDIFDGYDLYTALSALIRQGYDLNSKTVEGENILHLFPHKLRNKDVYSLIKDKVSKNDVDKMGRTPLIYNLHKKTASLEDVEFLSHDIDHINKMKIKPKDLFILACMNSMDIFKYLYFFVLKKYICFIDIPPECMSVEIYKFLHDEGLPIPYEFLLFYFFSSPYTTKVEDIEYFLSKYEKVNSLNEDGDSLLHIICKKQIFTDKILLLFSLLFSSSSSSSLYINIRNMKNETPLMTLCKNDKIYDDPIMCVKFLIDKGARVNDTNGEMPLIFLLLFSLNYDEYCIVGEKYLPVYYLKRKINFSTLSLLLDSGVDISQKTLHEETIMDVLQRVVFFDEVNHKEGLSQVKRIQEILAPYI
jgi:ankyrin repeat protein